MTSLETGFSKSAMAKELSIDTKTVISAQRQSSSSGSLSDIAGLATTRL